MEKSCKVDTEIYEKMLRFWNSQFLILAESITLKSFFYMIRGTKNKPKSIKNRCQKEVRKNDAKRKQKRANRDSKMIPNLDILC